MHHQNVKLTFVFATEVTAQSCTPWFKFLYDGRMPLHTNKVNIPLNTWRNDNVVITSKRRYFDVITSKWRRFDVITTLLLRNVFAGMSSLVTITTKGLAV